MTESSPRQNPLKNTLFSGGAIKQPLGMFGLFAAVATLAARPIRPSGAPDSSQKTRFVPTHARFVTFFGMSLERLPRKGIKPLGVWRSGVVGIAGGRLLKVKGWIR